MCRVTQTVSLDLLSHFFSVSLTVVYILPDNSFFEHSTQKPNNAPQKRVIVCHCVACCAFDPSDIFSVRLTISASEIALGCFPPLGVFVTSSGAPMMSSCVTHPPNHLQIIPSHL